MAEIKRRGNTGSGLAKVYCMSCKDYRQGVNMKKVTLGNGRKAVKGKCSECGKSVMKFIKG